MQSDVCNRPWTLPSFRIVWRIGKQYVHHLCIKRFMTELVSLYRKKKSRLCKITHLEHYNFKRDTLALTILGRSKGTKSIQMSTAFFQIFHSARGPGAFHPRMSIIHRHEHVCFYSSTKSELWDNFFFYMFSKAHPGFLSIKEAVIPRAPSERYSMSLWGVCCLPSLHGGWYLWELMAHGPNIRR